MKIASKNKATWQMVSDQLDKLFVLPFAKNETPELRAAMIEAYLEACSYTWDDVIQCIIMENKS